MGLIEGRPRRCWCYSADDGGRWSTGVKDSDDTQPAGSRCNIDEKTKQGGGPGLQGCPQDPSQGQPAPSRQPITAGAVVDEATYHNDLQHSLPDAMASPARAGTERTTREGCV